jgi:hypothetical protein
MPLLAAGASGASETVWRSGVNDGAGGGEDERGTAALRLPSRTRSAAGGSPFLPAETARRRANDASRPPVNERVPYAGAVGFEAASLKSAGLRTLPALPCRSADDVNALLPADNA